MKKIIIPLLLLPALSAMAEELPSALVVNKADGSTYAYSVSGIRKLMFDSTAKGGMQIYFTDSNTAAEYSYSELSYLTFDNVETSIDEIEVSDVVPTIVYNATAQTVEIKSAIAIKSITVFDIEGRTVASFAPQTEQAQLDLAAFAPGVYVVNAATAEGSVTLKIAKR